MTEIFIGLSLAAGLLVIVELVALWRTRSADEPQPWELPVAEATWPPPETMEPWWKRLVRPRAEQWRVRFLDGQVSPPMTFDAALSYAVARGGSVWRVES